MVSVGAMMAKCSQDKWIRSESLPMRKKTVKFVRRRAFKAHALMKNRYKDEIQFVLRAAKCFQRLKNFRRWDNYSIGILRILVEKPMITIFRCARGSKSLFNQRFIYTFRWPSSLPRSHPSVDSDLINSNTYIALLWIYIDIWLPVALQLFYAAYVAAWYKFLVEIHFVPEVVQSSR